MKHLLDSSASTTPTYLALDRFTLLFLRIKVTIGLWQTSQPYQCERSRHF